MTLILPVGWTDFSGGGEVADYCGEPQTCINPPCGPIAPITYGLSLPELSCSFGGDLHHLLITISGGVPPYSWATTGGILTIVDTFNAELSIHADPTGAGDVGFFRPCLRYVAYNLSPALPNCSGAEPFETNATAQVFLGAYDCLGIHIVTDEGGSDDNIPPWLASTAYAHPIGDVDADRTYTMAISYGGTPDHVGPDPYSGTADSMDHEWSGNTSRCTTGPTSGINVSVTAKVAGRNGIHGTIWSGAPDYASEIKSLPIINVGPTDPHPTIGPLNYDGYIDVRTQTQIDTGCCVVPTGTDIVVTITDTNEAVAVIVIPVV